MEAIQTKEIPIEATIPSIYNVLTPAQKSSCLYLCALVAFLTPFTDTVYLPALTSIERDLDASESLVAATVSTYMGAVGLGQLLWGPLADYHGRRPVLVVAMIVYTAVTVACAVSPEINSLIVFRTLQGLVLGCTLTCAQASIADMYAPAERGAAMGAFLLPMLVGPIVAPLVGGALSDAGTWRNTFYLLIAMGAACTALTLALLRETHHYYLSEAHPEHNGERLPLPVLESPLAALKYFADPEIAHQLAVVATCFASMFTTLTNLPVFLAAAPYSLSPSIIGVCFLPVGVAMAVGSVTGGVLSDHAGVTFHQHPSGALVYSLVAAAGNALGCISFGIALQYKAHLATVLCMQAVVGLCWGLFIPGHMQFITTMRQSAAGSVGAVSTFVYFAAAAVSISVSLIIEAHIGVLLYYLILSVLILATTAWSAAVVASSLRTASKSQNVTEASGRDV